MFSIFKKKQNKKPESPVLKKTAQDTSSTIIPKEIAGIPFTHVQGKNEGKKLIMISLTTCGFCKKAMQFLNDNDFSFSFIYLDKVDPTEKKLLRSYVSKTFDAAITYPFLIIDNKKWISGFLRIEWEDMIK